MSNTSFCTPRSVTAAAWLWLLCGCSASTSESGGAGGSPAGTGGLPPAGGTVGSGGDPATGGASPTGGVSGQPTGGTAALDSSGGTGGGSVGGFGSRSGGAPPAGGNATGGVASGGSAATGGIASGGGGSGLLAIEGLTVEANPNNVLSAYVIWTTDQPADSVVQFGKDAYQWEVSDPSPVTDHRVLIIGMQAESSYQINAQSSAAGETANATTTHATGSLPPSIPVGQVPINDPERTSAGWTLMNIQKGDGNSFPTSDDPAQAVMYDMSGQPVWYHINGTSPDIGGAVSVDLTDRGILFGPVGAQDVTVMEPPREVDFAGNVIWECADGGCGRSEGDLSHHAGKLANGNYVVIRWIQEGQDQRTVVEEISPDQELVGSWDFQEFVPKPADASGDWCHGNSATIDASGNAVYISCRWMGLIKVTYQNPNLLWHLPATYNASGLGTLQFAPTDSQFTDIHDPEIHEDGTILFFDNGGWDVFASGEEHHSRAVEYQINEGSGTATLVWEFPGDFTVEPWYRNDWYQPFWGDADRLANGNVLITAGERGSDSESRVFEVTKTDGQVVWELRLGPDIGVYRAERIVPPLVRAIPPNDLADSN